MSIFAPITTSAKSVVLFRGRLQHAGGVILNFTSRNQSASCCFQLRAGCSLSGYTRLSVCEKNLCPTNAGQQKAQRSQLWSEPRRMLRSLIVKGLASSRGTLRRNFNISFPNQYLKVSVTTNGTFSKITASVGSFSWLRSFVSSGLLFVLLICNLSPKSAHAQAAKKMTDGEDDCDSLYYKFSHGKKVYTDFSIIGIPGDGRCLFRSVAHGACLRAGKPAPIESLQRELADDLRTRVADEFIKRRQETEWFVEGDFDTYVKQIRKPHVWGGEPELFIASHVLQMPITVYMYDKNAGGLISIAEYGQEYGKENPIRVLYHGFGHYDALLIPGRKDGNSKL